MQKLFDWISKTLSDGYDPSTTRLIAFLTVPATVIVPLIIWSILSIMAGKPLDFPGSLAGFIVSVNTLILGTLHINKREETKIELKK